MLFRVYFDARSFLLGTCLPNFQLHPQHRFSDLLSGCITCMVFWWLRQWVCGVWLGTVASPFLVLCSFRLLGKGHTFWFFHCASLWTADFFIISHAKHLVMLSHMVNSFVTVERSAHFLDASISRYTCTRIQLIVFCSNTSVTRFLR